MSEETFTRGRFHPQIQADRRFFSRDIITTVTEHFRDHVVHIHKRAIGDSRHGNGIRAGLDQSAEIGLTTAQRFLAIVSCHEHLPESLIHLFQFLKSVLSPVR